MARDDVDKVQAGLAAVVDLDGIKGDNRVGQLVAIYLGVQREDAPFFAGRHFTSFGENPPDRFVAADVVALGLLDVPVSWPGIVAILIDNDASRYSNLLAAIRPDVDLWRRPTVTSRQAAVSGNSCAGSMTSAGFAPTNSSRARGHGFIPSTTRSLGLGSTSQRALGTPYEPSWRILTCGRIWSTASGRR